MPALFFSRNCSFHVFVVLRLKGLYEDRFQRSCFRESLRSTVFVGRITGICKEVLAEYWREKKVGHGDQGEVTINC